MASSLDLLAEAHVAQLRAYAAEPMSPEHRQAIAECMSKLRAAKQARSTDPIWIKALGKPS